MRSFLLLLLLALTSVTYAKKEHTMKIKVVSYETKEPLANIHIEIRGKKSVLYECYSDSSGQATYAWKGKLKFAQIVFSDTSGNFRSNHYYAYKEELSTDEVYIDVKLTPVPNYAAMLTKFRERDKAIMAKLIEEGKDTNIYLGNEKGFENMTQPEFVGGAQGLQHFVRDNVRYPEIAIEMGEQGKIYLQFIIEADGTVSHVKVMRGVARSLDVEAMRLIYSMPQWEAGSCGGEKVRSRAMLPIYFSLK